MANKIDSNSTELRYSEETSIGVADGAAVWKQVEPNSYADFGGQVTNVARAPILADRQNKKGVLTDLDSSGGFGADLTHEALPDLGQGVFFADLETKDEQVITDVVVTLNDYTVADSSGYSVGDLVWVEGCDNAANNGLKSVSALPDGTSIQVTETAVTETPSGAPTIRRVGFEFASGDADIDDAGTLPVMDSVAKDMTEFGLITGEWVWIGGDGASEDFTTAANNGFKRLASAPTATQMVFDKSDATMVTEGAGALTIRVFFASRLLRNRNSSTTIVRRSYQLERQLGAPDEGQPAQIQAEYVVGAVPGQLQFNIPTADKATFDLSFTATDVEQIDGPSALKAGTRPELDESEAYNCSSDVKRIEMAVVTPGDEAPTPLFGFIQELSFTIDNNLSPNKAVGVLGAFDITAGRFAVSGSLTAYFDNVTAMQAIRANSDVTLDAHMVKANQGISFDFPLITLGDGRPNVESDQSITLPLSFEAATGAKIDPDLDHTLMMMFWDYLPDAAEV
jgi:hypothetical protein